MNANPNVLIKNVSTSTEIDCCLAIRYQVFVVGQNVPLAEEVDGMDEHSEHYLLLYNQLPVGTARVRYLGKKAKIERVAILDDYQGRGLGHMLMNFIIKAIRANGQINNAVLGAQSYAIPFYEKLGFIVCSEEYLDANILHKDMQVSW